MVVDFRPSRGPTLGVEWELGLVDARTGDLVCAAAEVVEEARGGISAGESRVHRELLRNTVELVTGICESVPQAAGDLRESRDVVRRVARQRGLEIFSAGTHPFARWYDQEISEGERYAALIERTHATRTTPLATSAAAALRRTADGGLGLIAPAFRSGTPAASHVGP